VTRTWLRALVCLVWICGVGTGCVPKRLSFGTRGELKDPNEILELTRQQEARVGALKGDAKLTVDSPRGKGTVTLYLAVARPQRLHIESMDFFGRPQGVLVSDGERFGLYQASDAKYYQGPTSPVNVSQILPIVLPPHELVALFLGEVPRIADPEPKLSLDPEVGGYKIVLRRPPITQTVWIHPEHFRVLRSEVRGIDAYDVELDDFQAFGTLQFPRKVRLKAPATKTELELRYTDISLNERPDDSDFDTSPPEGVTVIEVDERGNPRPSPTSR
jgi:outer membrane lipoprotein-sorting protein